MLKREADTGVAGDMEAAGVTEEDIQEGSQEDIPEGSREDIPEDFREDILEGSPVDTAVHSRVGVEDTVNLDHSRA